MKHIVLGTAGHVDHGKTALVKALTGIDTDRLREEKERGITIELGFAPLDLEGGERISVVDVPGHEKFVKNMVAGATGIDLVVMVVAADEGVMPQTREHLDICTLLGIRLGVVALTKVDLVDEDWLSLVQDDVREFLKGTFLADAPVIPCSAVTGRGIPEVRRAITEAVARLEERRDSGLFRLPIDRVFTMKGFGTVVTGTLVSGKVEVGDTVEIMPSKVQAKIRGIQVHNESRDAARAGQRTAINLQGVEKETVSRGEVLTHPGIFEAGRRPDVFLHYLRGGEKKFKTRSLVRFHTGTSEVIARVLLLNREEIEPGAGAFAQVLLDSPVVVMGRDRFVIRSYSPVRTIGGGEILDPQGRKQKRGIDQFLRELEILLSGTDAERVETIIGRAGAAGLSAWDLAVRSGMAMADLQKIIKDLAQKKKVILPEKDGSRIIAYPAYQALQDRLLAEIEGYHRKNPLKEGMPKEELRMVLPEEVDAKLFNMAARELEKEGRIAVEKESVRLTGHRVSLKGELEGLKTKIAQTYLKAKLTPPLVKEILERFDSKPGEVQSVLGVLLKEGVLLKVTEELYFHRSPMDQLKSDYVKLLAKDGKATPATFKDLTGLTRKFIIPLMEYFDATKLTIRVGDHRMLRERKEK
ncbi:MAG TPA: selenocysteine-specific translation elongation factor [Syntrophales bacterium]|nr:selenocysteine-specific translation elongation factor [Syntrophales bacterium]HRT61104.1 selenocysteine-specific translation elongation factor [Syntrophales bacterium]